MQKLEIEGQTYTNSIGMRFVRIEPGTFTMGSKNAELSDELTAGKAYLRDGDWDEHPVHQVTLTTPFYIGIFQVTNAYYEAFQPAHKELRGKLGFSQDDTEAVVVCGLARCDTLLRMALREGGTPLSTANRSGVGICVSRGDNQPFSYGRHATL